MPLGPGGTRILACRLRHPAGDSVFRIEIKPAIQIETGSASGESAQRFASAAAVINKKERVYGEAYSPSLPAA